MATNAQYLGFDDRLFRLIGIPILTVIIPPVLLGKELSDWITMLHSFVFTFAVWEVNRQVFIFVSKHYPGMENLKKRLSAMILLCVLVTAAICPIIGNILQQILPHDHPSTPPNVVQTYGVSYVMLLAVGALYESKRFMFLWKKTLLEKEQVERAHLASQLEGLRNQVNPHFLFNSLNTLIYLIPEHPDKAVRFVQQLSKVYRYVLESREAKQIPLEKELEFLHAYVFLLRERFGENLVVELRDLTCSDSVAIVPLTLQILFENAIKHNIISTAKPLRIEVFCETDHIVVRNNLQRKNQVMDSTGVGLDNIRTRYRLLTDRSVEVIVSHQYFTVALPQLSLSPVAGLETSVA